MGENSQPCSLFCCMHTCSNLIADSISMALALGVDVGTQGLKVVAWEVSSNTIRGRGAASYDVLPTTVPGRAEQEVNTWIEALLSAMKQVMQDIPDPASVRCIGVSGQQHGMVVLGSDNQPLRPAKLWCDVESASEAAELAEALHTPSLVPSFTITKLLWLKRHEPHVFEQVHHVLLPHDYVNFWLTGRMVMEAGDASGTGLMDVRTRQWDEAAIAAVDPRLKQWLPPLVPHDKVIGTLTPEAATALGLHCQVVVSPGSGDNAMSALGSGLVQPGPFVVSLGTSGTLFGKSTQPVVDPEGAVCPFCDATGGGLPLLCTLNCTLPPQEVSTAFSMSHAELTAAACKEPAGCSGLSFLPYLIGERTPNWPHASGTILGLRSGMLRPGLLYRAALEGATFSLLAGMQRLKHLGLTPTELRLVGGGARNALWRQIIADAFQLPVRLPAEPDSAALGAALQAAACWGGHDIITFITQNPPAMLDVMVQPDPSTAQAYAAAFQRFQQFGQHVFDKKTLS